MVENKDQTPEQETAPEANPAETTPPEEQGPKFDMNEAPPIREMSENPEMLKTPRISFTGALGKARNTVIGSKHLGAEMVRVGQDYLDLPINAVTMPVKVMGDLVTFHPIKAVKDLASGAGKSMGNIVDIASAPFRFGVAGAYEGGRAIKAVAKAPFQGVAWLAESPFKAWDILGKGLDKLGKLSPLK